MLKLDWPALGWIVPAVCAVLILPAAGLGEPVFGWIERKFSALAQRKFLAVAAIGLLGVFPRLLLLPSLHVPQPKVHDEFSYLLAGDTFAHGRLANPPHPMGAFFDTFHVLQHPSYASMYPPGQGFALALGAWLHEPWLGVVLSVAAMCMAFTWMLQGWMPAEWALLGGVLVWARIGVFSYWMNSYWGGAVAAAGAALVLGALARLWDRGAPRDAIVLALGAAILAVSRPLEGAIFFAPVAVAVAWWALRKSEPARSVSLRRIIAPFVAVLACAAAFIGFYNWRVTGNPIVFPHFIEGKLITAAIFLWQHDKPAIAYSNPQFEDFYRNFLPSLYQASWPAAVGQWWYKATDFWEFFLGPALSIPFLALPWVLRKPRNLFLLVQIALSAFFLWIVVYYHAHYAAPVFAAVFVLLMEGLRVLDRFRVFGKPVGRTLARLVALYCLLIGPVYFAQAASSNARHMVGWLDHHTAPLLAASAGGLLVFAGISFWFEPSGAGQAFRLPLAALESALLLFTVLQLCEIQRNLYADAFPYVDDVNEPFRKPVEDRLAALPGEHLVIVRYSKDHNSGEEYVYNAADIDRAKTVWAREIPGVDLSPLLQYFRNRDVWLYEPDEDDSAVQPYTPPQTDEDSK